MPLLNKVCEHCAAWAKSGVRGAAWAKSGVRGAAWPKSGVRGAAWRKSGVRGAAWAKSAAWPKSGVRGAAWPKSAAWAKSAAWQYVGGLMMYSLTHLKLKKKYDITDERPNLYKVACLPAAATVRESERPKYHSEAQQLRSFPPVSLSHEQQSSSVESLTCEVPCSEHHSLAMQ